MGATPRRPRRAATSTPAGTEKRRVLDLKRERDPEE